MLRYIEVMVHQTRGTAKVLAGSGSIASLPTGLLSATGKLVAKLRFLVQKYNISTMWALFILVAASASCTKDSTPKYALGDQGPGMGTIFYIAPEPFPCGVSLNEYCSFLEVAPAGWYGVAKDPAATMSRIPYAYSQYAKDHPATEPVGLGRYNTLVLAGSANTTASAVEIALQYNGGGLSDWYLPSLRELLLMQKSQSPSTGLEPDIYWSSSEYDVFGTMTWAAHMFNPGSQERVTSDFIEPIAVAKTDLAYIRPIRAF